MKSSKYILVIVLPVLWPIFVLADSPDFSTQSEFNLDSSIVSYPTITGLSSDLNPPDYVWQETAGFRVTANWDVSDESYFELQYQAGFVATIAKGKGDPEFDSGLSQNEGLYRIADLDNQVDIGGLNSAHIEQNLDRLMWVNYFSAADLYVGRQTINLGTARFVSPIDIFQPNTPDALISDYGPGVDAIRSQVMLGDLSSLDFGKVFGQTTTQEATFVRLKSNFKATDWSATYVLLDEKQIISVGIETAVGQYGIWQELANLSNSIETRQDWRWSLGFDITIANYLSQFEYHFNQAGASSTEKYLTNAQSDPFYEQGAIGLLGQHYLTSSFVWLDGARSSHDLSIMYNLTDQSALIMAGFGWSFSENFDLIASVNIPLGESPIYVDSELVASSDFGSYPVSFEFQILGR